VALTGRLSVAVQTFDDVLWARQEVRRFIQPAGFPAPDVERIDVAVSELATNLVKHGGGGRLDATHVSTGPREGVELVAEDHGPGIPDVPKALADGYSTTGTYGAGLATLRELMDLFELHSTPGAGTRVKVVKWVAPC
jgi:serine/threonine-protein kinase RsbT